MSLKTALAHLRSGDLDAAERDCQALLRRSKRNPDAWHLCGLLHHKRGRHTEALEAYDRALALTPDDPELLLNRGNTLSALQRPDAALAMFERVLALRPDHIGALNNKANALQDLARPAEALLLYTSCLARMPAHAMLRINCGTALRALGRNREARDCFEQALRLEPHNGTALSLLTATLQVLGDPQAETLSLQAIGGEDDTPQQQARRAHQQGSVLMAMGKNQEAAARFAEALTIDPDHRESRLDLALLDYGQGRLTMAEQGFRGLLRSNPNDIAALNNLANVLRDMGRLEEGLACLDRAIAIPPYRTEPLSNRLMTLQYHPGKSAAELLEAARSWGHKAELRASDLLGGEIPPLPFHPQVKNAPLRVGYVSGDFWQHVVSLFFRDVLRHHDSTKVVPILYSNNGRVDSLTQQLRHQAKSKGGDLIDISHLNDRTLREQILNDRIDVLVDLSGHSAHSRVNAFALRPAPVQISWLGYFASTGLPSMDYVILDPSHAPPGTEQQYSEQILRLPHNRFCYTAVPGMPEVAPPPCERNGHITFGSFNNTCKLNDQVLEAWAQILAQLPGSRLILKNRAFADGPYCEGIRAFFARHGIAADRLELRGLSPHFQMLSEYGDLDIALDPFPFSGGYTSCEALWMGVPVVTLPQERVVSRQTLSFLTCLGLEGELAATDLEDYKNRALALARNSRRMVALRGSLRQRMADSPLCDAKRFTRDLENLYEEAVALAQCSGGRRHLHHRKEKRQSQENTVGKVLKKSPEYIVVAPPYDDKSAGVWMLHFLVHTLNKLGISASLLPNSKHHSTVNPSFETPVLINIEDAFLRDSRVIYPEIIGRNPLNASKVIRYMLNREGFVNGVKIDAGPNDFILSYHEFFHPRPNFILYRPVVDLATFNDFQALNPLERNLDLYYVGKGVKYAKCLPVEGAVELTRTWPSRKNELALLLRNARYLFSYDSISSISADAVLCGCIPVLLIDKPLARESIYNDETCAPHLRGFLAGDFKNYFEKASTFRDRMQVEIDSFPARVLEFHELADTFFSG